MHRLGLAHLQVPVGRGYRYFLVSPAPQGRLAVLEHLGRLEVLTHRYFLARLEDLENLMGLERLGLLVY